ncbi:unnamed protein product, partial [Polarella glacialis]
AMYFVAVPVTFAICSGLFLGSFCLTGALVEQSCSRVSAFHHAVAMCLGLYAHWCYGDRIGTEASFGANDQFPWAVLLQHFNIGYFLYDSVHVAVWDQKFMLHHIIAIAGYSTSELANVFGLANAVNTWITELGSLMYSAYLMNRSDAAYTGFAGNSTDQPLVSQRMHFCTCCLAFIFLAVPKVAALLACARLGSFISVRAPCLQECHGHHAMLFMTSSKLVLVSLHHVGQSHAV